MRKYYPLLLLTIFIITPKKKCMGQIVNMESQRYQTDTTGWAGTAGGNFALSNYGQKVFAVNAHAHVQYKSKKSLYLFLGGYGFLKGDQQSFVDHGFLHFRYNYKLTKTVRLEAFTQVQQNVITKIQYRYLFGAGPRFKILGLEKLRIYAGTLPMYEIEKEKDRPKPLYDWRLSNYLSITWVPNKQTELTTTTYYQPVLFDIGDYRLLNQSSLKVKAGKKIAVAINWNYQYDASPAAGIVTDTYNFSTGIEVEL
ncbi:MAG: DUF481 domain-containing protein [Chitinophagaceae bacterium]|nr:DUF481 domain-containing protein [Chitinophagaceae bacterium]